MSDFAQAPWVGNPDYQPGMQDCSTTGDYPDHPEACAHGCGWIADCECELCEPDEADHYCETCCEKAGSKDAA